MNCCSNLKFHIRINQKIMRFFKTFNSELDRKLGGGVVHPQLILMEGDHGAGKTVFSMQFAYGALRSGMDVVYISTELDPINVVMGAASIGMDVRDWFIGGKLRVYSVEAYPKYLEGLLRHVSSLRDTAVFVDSLTNFVRGLDGERITDVFYAFRGIVDRQSNTLSVAVHNGILTSGARALTDTYMVLEVREVGGRLMRLAKLVKARAPEEKPSTAPIAFEVDPAFGIKVLPFSQARA